MTTKYTPGPWVVSAGQVFISKAIKGGFKKICKIEPGQEHNATLIAAAPDLLDLAKDALEQLEKMDFSLSANWNGSIKTNISLLLEKAIAKAEGR